jgi:ribonuclease Z
MEASKFSVTLLGTGTPVPSAERFGPSTLVEVGGLKFLFDAGRGATIRLSQLGISLSAVDVLFLTHYHSDHTVGIPDLWLTGWLPPYFGGRKGPFRVIGPTGARALMENLEKAYALDIQIRIEDEVLPPEGIVTNVSEYTEGGVVFEQHGVKIVAFEVDHGDAIKPAYGYRIDFGGRSVVLSGDTRYNENVVKYATGTDLLVHEVAACRPESASLPHMRRIIGHHTTPHQAGMVFTRVQPKMAAFTHLVLLPSALAPAPTIEDIVSETRTTYSGPLEVGEDLMTFEIADAVTVRRWVG